MDSGQTKLYAKTKHEDVNTYIFILMFGVCYFSCFRRICP